MTPEEQLAADLKLAEEAERVLRRAEVESLARKIMIGLARSGSLPNPGWSREVVRLVRDFYDEIDTPTVRPPKMEVAPERVVSPEDDLYEL